MCQLIVFSPLETPAPLPLDASRPALATPLDPTLLVAALLADPARARALLAALSPTQRLAQALEHARWLQDHDVLRSHDEVLQDWQALLDALPDAP